MNPLPLPTTVPARPLKAFLVEDSQAVRDLIVASLSDIPGLVVSGFSDAEGDALLQLREKPVDVVIFDIELRQGNGMSLLRSMSTEQVLPECLKIIFSNNVSAAYRRIGNQYGIHHFLDKTYELPTLHALLAQFAASVGNSEAVNSHGASGAI